MFLDISPLPRGGKSRLLWAMIDSVEPEAGGASPDLKKARREKAPALGAVKVDRLPPHSIEAEQGVLGCVLLSPNDCMGICIEKFKAGSEVFYDLRHRHIYELLDEVERDVLRISEERVEASTSSIKDLVHKAINTIEVYHQRQGMLTGIATGFVDLDKMTCGLHAGEMIVIAARPSMGKTSLAMNIAEHVAVEQRLPVGVFSLEMTAESLVLRMLCSRSRVNLRSIRDGFLAERDFPRLTGAAGKLAGAPLFIDDSAGLSILQLRAKARRMWQQYGIKLFVIDYLQQMHSNSRKVDNRQQEIADISNGVKALAKELSVPVIVLSQLNRDFERDKMRKPNLADLRESGAIEQDADVVGLLYKADPDDPNKRKDDLESEETGMTPDVLPVNLLIAKQRNGHTSEVNLTFLLSLTRFESSAKITKDVVP